MFSKNKFYFKALFLLRVLYIPNNLTFFIQLYQHLELTVALWLHINYQLDTLIIIYSFILTQPVYRQAATNLRREWQYHMLYVYNCILLKMSTWGSKHVEEYNILWINNNQCIKLVINIQLIRETASVV